MDLDIPSSDQRARQVSELLDRGRVSLARDTLRAALAADPQHPDLLFQAARAEAQANDHRAARSTLGRVLQIEPGHLGARLLILWLLTEDGELVDAEELALALLHERPDWPDLYAAYARVMLRALKLGKARDLCKAGLRLDPDNDSALRTMALCDLIERPGGADSEALRKLLASHPNDQHVLSLVVVGLSQAGRSREALRGAKELLRMQPNEPQWLENVRRLRFATHWSMLPLWPLHRFGWGASIAMWIGGILVVRMLGRDQPTLANTLSWIIFGYAIYSWVWPPLLRWLLHLRD